MRKNLQTALQTNDSETTQEIITLHPELMTQTDSNGMNFLHRAVVNNDINAINTLIETDIDLNIAVNRPGHANHGKTILDLALELGHTTAAPRLILAGAILSNETLHPIHIAVKNGHLETVDALFQMNPSILNITNQLGQTPLHYAAANGYLNIVQHLVGLNADVNHSTNSNKTAVQLADKNGHPDVAKYLVEQAHATDHEVIRVNASKF